MAALTIVPASPVAKVTAARIDVSAADTNRADHSEFRYYIKISVGGEEVGRSYVFNVSSDGLHSMFTYIFPSAGSYTVTLNDVVGDGVVATTSPTVS